MIKKRDYALRRIWESRSCYVMMLPFMVFFLLFTVIPILAATALSFTDFNMLEIPKFIGWENYVRLFTDDADFLKALKNTLILALINGPLGYIVAFFIAWLINELNSVFRVAVTLIFYAPSISGNIYFIWKFLFSGDSYGYINGLLMQIGIIDEPVLWLSDANTALIVIIIIQFWTSLGVSFLAFIAGFQSVDKAQYEAGSIDGIKNRFQELWFITVPNMKNLLFFGAVMQIANMFSVGQVTQELTGGYLSIEGSTLTIINHMTDYGTVRYEMGYASAVAVVLFLLVLLTKKLVFRLLKW